MLRTLVCRFASIIISAMLFAATIAAQESTSPLGNVLGARALPGENGFNAVIATSNVDIYVQEAGGAPVENVAVVTLLTLSGQFYRQATTKAGYVRFNDVAPTEYRVQVVAPTYERGLKEVDAPANSSARLTIVLQPSSNSGDKSLALGMASMKPKAQKEMAKAMDALRGNKPSVALTHLDAVNRLAPNQAEVSYLFGVYALQTGDVNQAKSYWMKTVEQNPRHFRALLSLSEIALREKKPADAEGYLKSAMETEPTSWRPHAILAQAYYMEHSREEAIKQVERAVELGHGDAAMTQPLLARCLAERGERDRAIKIMQQYLQGHAGDAGAKRELEQLQDPHVIFDANEGAVSAAEMGVSAITGGTEALPPSAWMPPDVDENVPPVEHGAACAIDEVVRNAGSRLQDLVKNVDRFTATELVIDESLNKWGQPASSEKAQFDYIVSMEETRRGALTVEEYRERRASSKFFPDTVMTTGLPALVVIFHPYYASNYEMTCEGLARWNGSLAWQVHFRQRNDKPNTIRSYRMGLEGQGYPVALKGRAWIAADTYQIVRLETSMVAPMPQIRLAAEHVTIDYSPVQFRQGALEMWLPADVEVYYDWKGRRVHRQHKFSNYLLFSVDDKQKISAPKGQEASPPEAEKPR